MRWKEGWMQLPLPITKKKMNGLIASAIAPATVSRKKIHETGLSFRNEVQRNEESILLLSNNLWILRPTASTSE
ncbi:MAG: hypothetical protein HGB36_05975 [Chlorobiaceae bacterium]|nr:hypothetical protein [Chlorobiaceae bacterium]